MSLYDLYLSIDGRCLLGFACLEMLLHWVHSPHADVLPAPRCDCIARVGKDHWLITDVKTKTGV